MRHSFARHKSACTRSCHAVVYALLATGENEFCRSHAYCIAPACMCDEHMSVPPSPSPGQGFKSHIVQSQLLFAKRVPTHHMLQGSLRAALHTCTWMKFCDSCALVCFTNLLRRVCPAVICHRLDARACTVLLVRYTKDSILCYYHHVLPGLLRHSCVAEMSYWIRHGMIGCGSAWTD